MIKITDDVFDIASRIKSINSEYELFFDKDSNKFKVYAKNTLQAVLPFSSLDKRTVDYLLKTQIKNIDKLQKEVDDNNEKIYKKIEDSNSKNREYALSKIKN